MRAVRTVIVAIASVVVVVALVALARVGGSDSFEVSPQPAQSAPLSGSNVVIAPSVKPIVVTSSTHGTTKFVPALPATP